MARPLTNIFPELRGKMAEANDDVNFISKILGISKESVRRSLKGERDFRLNELNILANRYRTSIDKLFAIDDVKTA